MHRHPSVLYRASDLPGYYVLWNGVSGTWSACYIASCFLRVNGVQKTHNYYYGENSVLHRVEPPFSMPYLVRSPDSFNTFSSSRTSPNPILPIYSTINHRKSHKRASARPRPILLPRLPAAPSLPTVPLPDVGYKPYSYPNTSQMPTTPYRSGLGLRTPPPTPELGCCLFPFTNPSLSARNKIKSHPKEKKRVRFAL